METSSPGLLRVHWHRQGLWGLKQICRFSSPQKPAQRITFITFLIQLQTPISEGPRALEHILIIILKVLSIIMHTVLFHNIIFSGYKWSSHSKVLSIKDDIIYVPLNHHENSLCSTRKNYSCLWIKKFFSVKMKENWFLKCNEIHITKKSSIKIICKC